VLVFERLRVIEPKGGSKAKRLNRKQVNQLKGKIDQLAKEKAYAVGIVACETNAHGTSQYCSGCGARGERFSRKGSVCILGRSGKLFRCRACSYEAQADFNASVNVHHSFFREFHWRSRKKRRG
jgi:transposase